MAYITPTSNILYMIVHQWLPCLDVSKRLDLLCFFLQRTSFCDLVLMLTRSLWKYSHYDTYPNWWNRTIVSSPTMIYGIIIYCDRTLIEAQGGCKGRLEATRGVFTIIQLWTLSNQMLNIKRLGVHTRKSVWICMSTLSVGTQRLCLASLSPCETLVL